MNFHGFSALDINEDGFFDQRDIPFLFKKLNHNKDQAISEAETEKWAEKLLYELFYKDALSNPQVWKDMGVKNSDGLFKLLDTTKNNLNGITALEFKRFMNSVDQNNDKKVDQKEIQAWIRTHY